MGINTVHTVHRNSYTAYTNDRRIYSESAEQQNQRDELVRQATATAIERDMAAHVPQTDQITQHTLIHGLVDNPLGLC